MDAREFDMLMGRLMKQDFSADAGAFRDALLGRCIAELDAQADCAYIPDADLDMLAAAGEIYTGLSIDTGIRKDF